MGPSDGRVVLVTGVIAAGKSTIAQLLAERFEPSVHLRGDVFRRMVVRGNAAPNTDAFDVAQLDRILHDETPHVGTWIDNSDQTPEQTVEAILGELA